MSESIAKHEWRKREKDLYLPGTEPSIVDVPRMNVVTIAGQGNPNHPEFAEYIGVLYSISYGIKMTAKKPGQQPEGHMDYTVYPLEGVWDITEEARTTYSGTLNKDDLVFTLMIRQPDFVTRSFFDDIMDSVRRRKPHRLLDRVIFTSMTEGRCVQMLHIGPYDDEPASFLRMEAFAEQNGLRRLSKVHREIYLSDFRRTAPEKLKTALRFQVK